MSFTEHSIQQNIVFLFNDRASLVTQMVKNPPARWETWVQSLGWNDPQEEGTATTPVFLRGESTWTEETGRLYSPQGHKESDTTEQLSIAQHI